MLVVNTLILLSPTEATLVRRFDGTDNSGFKGGWVFLAQNMYIQTTPCIDLAFWHTVNDYARIYK